MLSIKDLMSVPDFVMNNQAICLGIGVLEKQKYANKDCGIAVHVTVGNKVSLAFSTSGLGVGREIWFSGV